MKTSFARFIMRVVVAAGLLQIAFAFSVPTLAAAEPPRNLAIDAQATASEALGDLSPNKAIDGKAETRWSGIPGHNEGVWFELQWKQPVTVGQVVVDQFDTFAMEWDLQVREDDSSAWHTIRHFGTPGQRLPKAVTHSFAPIKIVGLRIANITNGPSFNEVQVFERPFANGIATVVASDLRGHFLGIVCDPLGGGPIEAARVTLSGKTKAGPWQSAATSDAKGIFLADMPLGLTGKILVRTELKTPEMKEQVVVQSQVDSVGLPYRLTPREARHNATSLDGRWKFCLDPPEDLWRPDFDDSAWKEIKVPANWEMEGFHSDSGVGGYRRHFNAPSQPGRVKLAFDGVYSGAEVWVNGHLVVTHEGITPFEVDISDVVQPAGNLLAVRVKEHTIVSDNLDHMSLYADFPLAGIMRPVVLFTTPEIHLTGLEVTPVFDQEYRNATLKIRGCVVNESTKPFQGSVEMRLADPKPSAAEVAKSEPMTVELAPWQAKEIECSIPVTAPKKWDAEHPNLYLLQPYLSAEHADSGDYSMYSVPVGFRQTDIRGTQVLINGRPVKFHGTCHHDSHPLMGRAVTAELERKDLMLMREANLNAVRTSHYLPLADLPYIADELGLYVEAEGSFCWADGTNDLRNTPRIMQLNAELLARDRNHPSVAFWSVCNESQYGYGLQRAHEWMRKADPSRPCSAATSATLEIATLHNPIAIPRMQRVAGLDRPMLFDESHGIFQGIFNDVAELWVDPGMRDYYVEPYVQGGVQDFFVRDKVTQGAFIWCWGDDLFCVPGRGFEYGRAGVRCHYVEDSYRMRGRGIVGDAPWGVIDGWRRRKPEHWITKKINSPVKVKETPLPLPAAGEPINVAVENQYDFTNLSELKIRWTIGEQQGDVRADVPARLAGMLAVKPDEAVKDGQVLALEFVDRGGQLVDTYRIPLGRERPYKLPGAGCTPSELRILRDHWLAGNLTTIAGKDFRVAICEDSGLLMRCVGRGEAVMLELPTLHVLPAARPQQPLPDRLTWHLDKFDVAKQGENVRVTLGGGHQDFQGGYELTITPAGEMTVESNFEYTGGDLLVRETGLRFSVPRDCDVLNWDRKGEWNVYPADHIGRPHGTARAFPKPANAVPPTGPWSRDVSPMGSNDFRSTKRHINWAAIHFADGPGVAVESNGEQHVRAAVDTDRISIHVNDWYGGTNAGMPEWFTIYGSGKPLHKGERITSKVKLSIRAEFPNKGK
jgi:beta-galactosidase